MRPYDSETERYVADGFLCRERILGQRECYQLFAQMISEWKSNDSSLLHLSKPRFRISYKSEYNALTAMLIQKTLAAYRGLLKMYFGDGDLFLAELSSLCVFPGAKCQLLHVDHVDPEANIITFFINLFDVDQDCGPLAVVPGYHKKSCLADVIDCAAMQTILLPAGSCVAMDGHVPHCGMPNRTPTSIKPVIYFSVGDPGYDGPYDNEPLRININHLYA